MFSTMIVVLVFIPLFALSGMEGQLFRPLGVAYIVSILASLFVSLTVTPVLSYWLLGHARLMEHGEDGFVLRGLKGLASLVIRFSLRFPKPVLLVTVAAVIVACHFTMDSFRRNILLRSLFFVVFGAATLACLFWSFTF